MYRTLDMRAVVLLRRKHVDDLPARGEHRQHFTMVNLTHFYLLSGSNRDCSPSLEGRG